MIQQILDTSVLFDQFYSRLLPDAVDTRYIVCRIPHQCQHLNKLFRSQIKFFQETFLRNGIKLFAAISRSIYRDEIAQVTQMHRILLEATEDEGQAAIEAILNALGHPLLTRAARSDELYREYPIQLKLEGREVAEGTIDLAFLEDGRWVVVDFKTDANLLPRQESYRTQVEWYVYSLAQITGLEAEGWLLGI